MRTSIVSLNGSLLQRFIGIAAALLVVLRCAPDASAQGCTNVCPGAPWVTSVFKYEFSPGCWVDIAYRWRTCTQVPDFDHEVYIESVELATECNECRTAFDAMGISGWIRIAREAVSSATDALDLDPGDLTIAWPKCWQKTGYSWAGCSDATCCERVITAWTPGNNGTTTTSDPGTCTPPCVDTCP